jgi:hypothetical protein
MKKLMFLWALIGALILVCPVLAQPGPGGGMGMRGGMGPMLYNPQTVTTVKGAVEKLEELPSMGRGSDRGMMYQGVLLKTDKGSLMVHLAPSWYLDEQKFTVKAGDTLEVTGSQVTLNNQAAIIAREVKVNDQILKLRDEKGIPAWSRTGRGPRGSMGPGSGQGSGAGGM